MPRTPAEQPQDAPSIVGEDFVSDAEIARRWGVGEKTARIAIRALEQDPRWPKKDPLFGGRRYWPKVRAYLRIRYGLSMTTGGPVHAADDGEENWSHESPEAKHRPGARPAMATTR